MWKIAKDVFNNMEKEGFHFGSDDQVTGVLTELIAFMLQIADRMVYGHFDDEQRSQLITGVAKHLGNTMETNEKELRGPGDYFTPFINMLNSRAEDYAECSYNENGPGYEFKRYLGERISDVMVATDNRWVVEHVMEIEAPKAIEHTQRLITDVVGLRRS